MPLTATKLHLELLLAIDLFTSTTSLAHRCRSSEEESLPLLLAVS